MSTYIGPKASDVPVGTIGTQTVTANSIVVGSNVALTTTQLSIGNSTVNAVANSTAFYSSGNAISPYGMRNRIINGGMQVWQRGTSFTPSALNFAYSSDRWNYFCANSATTVSQSTSVPSGYQYSIKIQRNSSQTFTNANPTFLQVIESVNCFDLAGQTVTLSFWAKAGANFSASSSALGCQIATGTVADQGSGTVFGSWTGFAAPLNTFPILTTNWQKYTYTATLGSGVLEAAVIFYYTPTGTAGSDDSFYITGVQLELGSVATPFERRPYGMELALCQRYYEQIGGESTNQGLRWIGYNSTGAGGELRVAYKQTKRAFPTANIIGTWTYNNCSQPIIGTYNTNYLGLYTTVTTTGGAYFYDTNTSCYVTVSAEL
jgi:hypothetical protein